MTPATRRALVATAALLAAPAPAQVPAAPAPTPQATPTIVPGLDDFSIPGTPVPAATATPSPAPTPPPEPAARAIPRPTATPTPRRSATPTPEPAPTVAPSPSPVPLPSATPTPAQPAPAAPAEGGGLWWPIGVALSLLAGLLAWRALRRREPEAPDPLQLADEAPPAQPESAFAPPTPRARLALDLRPLRAGLNLLSATVECEVAVTNAGDAPAHAVRLGVTLLSAHAGQDADLAEAYAQPVARPAAPPFTLQPGETRRVRAVAALPHADIRAMEAAGRPIFVPLVAVDARYRAADGVDGQTAQAFAVGVERAGSPKLAPFRLDRPARTTTEVAARPHAAAVTR